jgi:hypothetical protein
MIKGRFWRVCLSAFGFTLSAWAQSPPDLSQQPSPVIVPELFQFAEGTWAEYEMLDKSQEQPFTLKLG